MQIKLESPTKTADLKYGINFSWCQGLFVVVVWCLTQCWSHSQYALYDHLSESGALPWTCIWLRKMGSMCLPGCKTRFVSKFESQDTNIAYIDFLLHLSKTPSSLLRSVHKRTQLSKTETQRTSWMQCEFVRVLLCGSLGCRWSWVLVIKIAYFFWAAPFKHRHLTQSVFTLDELHTWTTVVSAWKNWSIYAQTTELWLGLMDVNTHIISIFHNTQYPQFWLASYTPYVVIYKTFKKCSWAKQGTLFSTPCLVFSGGPVNFHQQQHNNTKNTCMYPRTCPRHLHLHIKQSLQQCSLNFDVPSNQIYIP